MTYEITLQKLQELLLSARNSRSTEKTIAAGMSCRVGSVVVSNPITRARDGSGVSGVATYSVKDLSADHGMDQEDGYTLLQWAAFMGDVKALRNLLKGDERQVDEGNGKGVNVLNLLLGSSALDKLDTCHDILRTLVSRGCACSGAASGYGFQKSPLMLVAERGHIKAFTAMVNGIDGFEQKHTALKYVSTLDQLFATLDKNLSGGCCGFWGKKARQEKMQAALPDLYHAICGSASLELAHDRSQADRNRTLIQNTLGGYKCLDAIAPREVVVNPAMARL